MAPLILALAWAAGNGNSRAQIYEQGLIGYYGAVFQTGSNLFCAGLQDEPANFSLMTMFPAVPNGTVVLEWDSSTLAFDTNSIFENGGWSLDLPLPSGVGFLLVTQVPFTNAVIGTVLNHDGDLLTESNEFAPVEPVFSGPNGVYLLGDKSHTVDTGTNILINILGRMPNEGEQVIQISGTSTYFGNGVWDMVPTLDIGQAAFLNIGPVGVPELPGTPGWVNLNFEMAKNLGNPGSFGQINPTNAFPGWTVNADFVVYDDFSLSGGSASIIDTNSNGDGLNFPTIQGKYFA